MRARNCTFRDATMHVDGQSYRGCRFERCRLIYSGGDLPRMIECVFVQCHWTLEGAGARTLRLMKAMVERGGSMRELVERSLGLTEASMPEPHAEPPDSDRHPKRLH